MTTRHESETIPLWSQGFDTSWGAVDPSHPPRNLSRTLLFCVSRQHPVQPDQSKSQHDPISQDTTSLVVTSPLKQRPEKAIKRLNEVQTYLHRLDHRDSSEFWTWFLDHKRPSMETNWTRRHSMRMDACCKTWSRSRLRRYRSGTEFGRRSRRHTTPDMLTTLPMSPMIRQIESKIAPRYIIFSEF